MDLREATLDDAPDVAALLTQLGYPVDPETARTRIAATDETVVLATDGSRVLALMALDSYRCIAYADPIMRITSLVVGEGGRRAGVGRVLIEEARRRALARGCQGLEVTSGIRAEREGAHAFYPAQGFQLNSHRYWMPLAG
ncbi:MAG TPA: GNAT family N-acetyltransferase [Candidatus Dormibacteraeota bacterium]|jgi:GNAT superfamily N-acetyltransferase|nr:GNAT family N-acetyltransferase [Candidatus Dormibacteraeota bacterium]